MCCPSKNRRVNFAPTFFAHRFLSIGKAASFKIARDCCTVHLRPNKGASVIRLKVKEIAESKGISQSKLGRMADIGVKTMRRIYRYPTKSITMILRSSHDGRTRSLIHAVESTLPVRVYRRPDLAQGRAACSLGASSWRLSSQATFHHRVAFQSTSCRDLYIF